MTNSNLKAFVPLAFLPVFLASAVALAEEDKAMLWLVTPYIWFTDTDYTLKADGSEIGAGTITASDLFDSLEIGGQVVVEAGREGGNWSAFVDATYLKLSDSSSIEHEELGQIQVDADSKQWLIDAAVSWWPQGMDGAYSLYGGLRYTSLDDETRLSLAESGDEIIKSVLDRDFTDLLIGGRYRFDLNDRWAFHTKADYAFGDSEGIFQAQAFFMYKLNRGLNGLIAGYRYKEAEFEANGISEDYEYSGPFIGFNFRF